MSLDNFFGETNRRIIISFIQGTCHSSFCCRLPSLLSLFIWTIWVWLWLQQTLQPIQFLQPLQPLQWLQ